MRCFFFFSFFVPICVRLSETLICIQLSEHSGCAYSQRKIWRKKILKRGFPAKNKLKRNILFIQLSTLVLLSFCVAFLSIDRCLACVRRVSVVEILHWCFGCLLVGPSQLFYDVSLSWLPDRSTECAMTTRIISLSLHYNLTFWHLWCSVFAYMRYRLCSFAYRFYCDQRMFAHFVHFLALVSFRFYFL